MALSAAKDCLYVLDSCGIVHVRDNLNSHLTPRGKNWSLLNSKGLCEFFVEKLCFKTGVLASTIISFVASSQSLWAVTSDGFVWHSDFMSNPAETCWQFVDTPTNMAGGEKLDQVGVKTYSF